MQPNAQRRRKEIGNESENESQEQVTQQKFNNNKVLFKDNELVKQSGGTWQTDFQNVQIDLQQ